MGDSISKVTLVYLEALYIKRKKYQAKNTGLRTTIADTTGKIVHG